MPRVDPPGSSPQSSAPESSNRLADGPLRFTGHSMGVYCFGTWGCRATYGRHTLIDRAATEWQPAAEQFDRIRQRMSGTYGGLSAFEGPVVLEWLDSERAPRRLVLDLAEVFPDRRIRHAVPDDEIDANAPVGSPDIIIEVEDRTVRVHMRAHIPLKRPRIPGNRYTNFVDENVLVHETSL